MSNNQSTRSIVIDFDEEERTAGLSLDGVMDDLDNDEDLEAEAHQFQEDLGQAFAIAVQFVGEKIQGEMLPIELESLILMSWIQLVIATEEVDENVLGQLEAKMSHLYKTLNDVLKDSIHELEQMEIGDVSDEESLFPSEVMEMFADYVSENADKKVNLVEYWKDNKWKTELFENIQTLFNEFDEAELTDLAAIFTLVTIYTLFCLLRIGKTTEEINKIMVGMPVIFDQLMSELYVFMEIESDEIFE